MNNIENLFAINPFSLNKKKKIDFLKKYIKELSIFHYNNSTAYKRIIDSLNIKLNDISSLDDFPYLPVRLFKMHELLSVDKSKIIKTLMSSGTSGQSVSKIFLDKKNIQIQTKVLAKIMSTILGNKRLPMLIIDSDSVIKDRKMFSARGAGILGFSIFGTNLTYALDSQMNLNIEKINNFLQENSNKQIFIFGFTFMIWKYFLEKCQKLNIHFDLSNATLLHGGGWKKLISLKVNSNDFKFKLNNQFKLSKVFDYYGMVEQTGSIYIECEHNFFHTSIFSDIIVRRPDDFGIAGFNENGIIQLISTLPSSYPGHSILTEDEGYIAGEDDCKCGRKGKYFKILGRLKQAEIRGCSDTHE